MHQSVAFGWGGEVAASFKMALGKKFDYEQFRQQAVEQLRSVPITLASIRVLLAPVIQDLLEMALQADDQPIALTSQGIRPTTVEEIRSTLNPSIKFPDDTAAEANLTLGTHSAGQPVKLDKRVEHFVIENFYRGVSYETLQDQLGWEGWSLSMASLMNITNQGLARVEAWHKRPLFPIYTFLWVTSLPFQLWQDSPLANQSAYVVAGIDLQGRRDIIGYYVGERDLAQTWSTLLTDLQDRGVEDILIACGEEPSSLQAAFRQTYPQTHVHGCVMLQMRSSLQPLLGRDKIAATKILRALYTITDETKAAEIWQAFRTDWAERYPLLVENWERNWPFVTGPMQYPTLVTRRAQRFTLLDTLHQALFHHLKANGPYANEQEFLKSTYIISQKIVSKNKGGVGNWGLLVEQLASVFDHRVKKYLVA